jgi:hypothetical protein
MMENSSEETILMTEDPPANVLDEMSDRQRDLVVGMPQMIVAAGLPHWVREAWECFHTCLRQPIERWNPPRRLRKKVATVAGRSVERLAEICAGIPHSFLDDVADYCALEKPRDCRAVLLRLGMADGHQHTLDDIGQREGVTRERIRQVVKRFEDTARAWSPPLVLVSITSEAASRCGSVVTAYEIYSMLPEAMRPKSPFDLELLQPCIDFGWVVGLTTTPNRSTWIQTEIDPDGENAKDELQRKTAQVNSVVTKWLRRFGAIPEERLVAVAGEDGVGLARAYLRRKSGRISTQSGWLIPDRRTRSALYKRIERVFAVVEATTLPRLRRQLRRSIGSVPPEDVLRVLLKRDFGIQVDSADRVRRPRAFDESLSPLSRGEQLAVRLLSQAGGAMTIRDLQRAFVEHGLSAATAVFTAGRSPLLRRIRTGVVGLFGRAITPENVEYLAQQVAANSGPALLGFRNLPDQRLEVVYRLDPALLSTMLFSLPNGRIPERDWDVAGADGRITSRSGYLTGVRKFVRAMLPEARRMITLTFDPDGGVVQISGR